jgi:hypothetical protein
VYREREHQVAIHACGVCFVGFEQNGWESANAKQKDQRDVSGAFLRGTRCPVSPGIHQPETERNNKAHLGEIKTEHASPDPVFESQKEGQEIGKPGRVVRDPPHYPARCDRQDWND